MGVLSPGRHFRAGPRAVNGAPHPKKPCRRLSTAQPYQRERKIKFERRKRTQLTAYRCRYSLCACASYLRLQVLRIGARLPVHANKDGLFPAGYKIAVRILTAKILHKERDPQRADSLCKNTTKKPPGASGGLANLVIAAITICIMANYIPKNGESQFDSPYYITFDPLAANQYRNAP